MAKVANGLVQVSEKIDKRLGPKIVSTPVPKSIAVLCSILTNQFQNQ